MAALLLPLAAAAQPMEPELRRPGPSRTPPPQAMPEVDPGAVIPPPVDAFPKDVVPIPDRWRLVEAIGVNENLWDPYNQNTLKGDRPIFGTEDWFFVLGVISDTVVEPRAFPLPVGVQSTARPDSIDVFGRSKSFVAAETVILSLSLIQGSTAYKPPDLEFRLTPAIQWNYVDVEELRILNVRPSKGTERRDAFIGMQEAFIDYHFRNVSDRYDFDSVRVGIQPFSTDFRGFLFQDNQFGIRFFGNRDGNRWQYNLGLFQLLEKDTNSGLNDITEPLRDNYMAVVNLYRQDLPVPGLTSQATVVYNASREADDIKIDDNGFPVRPALLGRLEGRDYDVVYLGYNADGRIWRTNVTASAYWARGRTEQSPFTGDEADINAQFIAVEASYDYNWSRFRLSGMYASGDDDPYDDTEKGFDAIFENPLFAGADTNFWTRQPVPFIGGGRVIGLTGRNGHLPSLRSSKEQGQSNFVNPGLLLLGLGADFDLTPELRVSANANHLWFDDTTPLEELRVQGDIPSDIGWDLSLSATYRIGFIQNLVFRLSGAALLPGEGFKALFDSTDRDDLYYSILFNAVISF